MRAPLPPSRRQRRAPKALAGHPTTLGEHLRKARLDRGLRQDELARELGVGYQTVSNWERNYSRVGPRLLPKVVAFLGYDPREAPLPGSPPREDREEGPLPLQEIS